MKQALTRSALFFQQGNHHGNNAIDGLGNTHARRYLQYHDLGSRHPIERTDDVERPDISQCLQSVSAAEYPDFVLVEYRSVRVAWQGNVCGRERRARSATHRDVEDVDAVGV